MDFKPVILFKLYLAIRCKKLQVYDFVDEIHFLLILYICIITMSSEMIWLDI